MSPLPKVPPASRSPKGPQNLKDKRVRGKEARQPVPENLEEEGQAGNTFQNTHHQGHQQDR
ncbi:MAG: hypothetical protein IT535_05010 [Bauldia sp.]|nr:hypothetical protein [Bauldia sp.]